jgi:hypothetical protein
MNASVFAIAMCCTESSSQEVQSSRAIPDFSGLWGRSFLGLESPPSGPGPIGSLRRRADGTMDPLSGGDYTNTILRPAAAERVKKHGDIERSGRNAPNPHNQCRPEPVPFTSNIQFRMQLLQRPGKVLLLYPNDHKVRHIPMNVPHPADVTPTWQGDSVGHYEGDTLVIDTVALKVGPLSMVDWYGTPHSASLHVVERYRLIDGEAARDAQRKHESSYLVPGMPAPPGSPPVNSRLDPDIDSKGLQVEITVEDPIMFTTTWSALVTYRRDDGGWVEAVCAENLNVYHAEKDADAPQAVVPDF